MIAPLKTKSALPWFGSDSEVAPSDPVELAWALWAQCWIGRKGSGGTRKQATSASVRRTADGGNNASRLRTAARDLESWAKHFQRCEWENQDFRDVLNKSADRKQCGIYCDPPWVGPGRDYLHTFTEQDHRDLFECLSRFSQSTVVVRYGDAPLIREIYSGDCWTITEATSRTQSNGTTGELWICNSVLNCKEGC